MESVWIIVLAQVLRRHRPSTIVYLVFLSLSLKPVADLLISGPARGSTNSQDHYGISVAESCHLTLPALDPGGKVAPLP